MAIGPAVERLLCDTSFHAHAKKRAQAPERYEHWAPATIERIDAAILAISVMTLAEARYGYLKAGWGERRIAEEEGRLAAYLLVPLDPGVLDEWARLRAVCEAAAIAVPDNDLWIAATAATRGYPLVTCDRRHQGRIRDSAVQLIVLDVDPSGDVPGPGAA